MSVLDSEGEHNVYIKSFLKSSLSGDYISPTRPPLEHSQRQRYKGMFINKTYRSLLLAKINISLLKHHVNNNIQFPGFSSSSAEKCYMNLGNSKLKPGFGSAHFLLALPFQLLGIIHRTPGRKGFRVFHLPDSE